MDPEVAPKFWPLILREWGGGFLEVVAAQIIIRDIL